MSRRTMGKRTKSSRKAKRLGLSPLSHCELPTEHVDALLDAAGALLPESPAPVKKQAGEGR